MNAAGILDLTIAAGVLCVALGALFGRGRLTRVLMFVVFGVLISAVWARLEAPDVAMAEAIVGAGVTGALLLGTTLATRPTVGDRDLPGARGGGGSPPRIWPLALAGGALASCLAALLVLTLDGLRLTPGLGTDVRTALDGTGVSHPVTGILLDIRGYDTLLEVAVLAAAVIGALALLPRGDLRSVTPPTADDRPMTAMVRLLLPVLVLLVGWLLVAGSSRPGGAFHAGALLAGAFLLLHLAGIGSRPRWRRWLGGTGMRLALLVGLAAYLALAFGTAIAGDGWLVLDAAWSASAILALEAVLTVSIGATLAALLLAGRADPTETGEPDPAVFSDPGDGPVRDDDRREEDRP